MIETALMPEWLQSTVRLINQLPLRTDNTWKRLRIAISQQELMEFRRYVKAIGNDRFYYMIGGMPIIIEVDPMNPQTHVTYL